MAKEISTKDLIANLLKVAEQADNAKTAWNAKWDSEDKPGKQSSEIAERNEASASVETPFARPASSVSTHSSVSKQPKSRPIRQHEGVNDIGSVGVLSEGVVRHHNAEHFSSASKTRHGKEIPTRFATPSNSQTGSNVVGYNAPRKPTAAFGSAKIGREDSGVGTGSTRGRVVETPRLSDSGALKSKTHPSVASLQPGLPYPSVDARNPSSTQHHRATPSQYSKRAVASSAQKMEVSSPAVMNPSVSVSGINLTNQQQIFVNSRSYIVIRAIGKGGSCKVYEVTGTDNRSYALKCVDLLDADESIRKTFCNEVSMLRSLKDTDCVVQIYDFELAADRLLILMEKGEIDLATMLQTRRSEVDEHFIFYHWRQMLLCVKTMHDKGVVHSDLKPANFLFVKCKMKLIDFGIASAIPGNKTSVLTENQIGTLSYMSPEALMAADVTTEGGKSKYKVQKKSDVWSLGCILYNMVYGYTPFQHHVNNVSKMRAILYEDVRFKPIKNLKLLDMMKRCLTKDPVKRASTEELLEHEYFESHNVTSGSASSSPLRLNDVDYLRLAQEVSSNTPRTVARKMKEFMETNVRRPSASDLTS